MKARGSPSPSPSRKGTGKKKLCGAFLSMLTKKIKHACVVTIAQLTCRVSVRYAMARVPPSFDTTSTPLRRARATQSRPTRAADLVHVRIIVIHATSCAVVSGTCVDQNPTSAARTKMRRRCLLRHSVSRHRYTRWFSSSPGCCISQKPKTVMMHRHFWVQP